MQIHRGIMGRPNGGDVSSSRRLELQFPEQIQSEVMGVASYEHSCETCDATDLQMTHSEESLLLDAAHNYTVFDKVIETASESSSPWSPAAVTRQIYSESVCER